MAFVTPPPAAEDELEPDLIDAWQAVSQAYLDVRTRWFEVAAEVGLSPAGLDALLKVDPEQAPSMREMAELMGCDASYVTAMVDDLERSHYAKRHPSGTDRRVKAVVLTAAGRHARDRARARLTAPPSPLRNLPQSDQRALAQLLRQALGKSSTKGSTVSA